MAGDHVLALDIGTTSIKVGLFHMNGTLVKMAAREQALSFPAAGRVEQSPQLATTLIADCMAELLRDFDPAQVAAIGLTNHRGTAIALDAKGEPLTEFIVWMDKRGVPQVDWLLDNIGLERYYDTCGHPIVSYTGISKVLWIQRSAPDIWQRTAVIGPPQTYFLKWLGCEGFVCDVSSGTFLFPFDIDQQTWSTSLIGFPVEKLPRRVYATDIVGEQSVDTAQILGLPPGIPLVAGGGDGQCAGVGSGIIASGRAMINVGTGAGVQVFLEKSLRDPSRTLNCAAHVAKDFWEMEGHTQSSGAAFRWLRDEFGVAELALQRNSTLDAYDLLVEQARAAPPGAGGLIFLPTFNGSSAPIVDLSARGCLLGLSLDHGRGHIIRALMEGISMELRWMLDAILEMGTPVNDVYLAGGGARNAHWNQIHATILGRPVKTLRLGEAAMVGAAMCAAVALGEYEEWRSAAAAFVNVGDEIEPDVSQQAVYERLYDTYKAFFRLLSESGLFNRLTEISSED
jgi:xylulokinase